MMKAADLLHRASNRTMGWVGEEYQDRARADQMRDTESGPEMAFERAGERRWQDLVREIEADVAEYKNQGGSASFTKVSSHEVRVADSSTALVLTVRADIEGHAIHYGFNSTNERVASPEGGIFSIRPSRYGRAELYSADQRIHSEDARRMLLEPVMFPSDQAA